MEEIWKDVVGFEGRYQVSNLGNVKSLNYLRTRKSRNLSLIKTTRGYLKVCLRNERKEIAESVHVLVANAFLEKSSPIYEVNHINGNKSDNRADNLEWCSKSHNMQHAFDNDLNKVPNGSSHYNAKLNDDSVIKIREMFSLGNTPTSLAKLFNVSRATVWNIIKRQTWKHI